MSSFDDEEASGATASTCANGHPVGENDLFCPVCLEVVARSPATYWTTNDGRDLHPSSRHETSPDQ